MAKMRHLDVLVENTTGMSQQGHGMREGVLSATVPPGMDRSPEFLTVKGPATHLGPSGQVPYADAHHSAHHKKHGKKHMS